MIYLLDADVFIRAKNLHYGMDFCPAFWTWLIRMNRIGKVYSIEEVRKEIQAIEDELSHWTTGLHPQFFLHSDLSTVSAGESVSKWVSNQGYEEQAVHSFLGKADYHLVAHAYAGKHTVVTHERSSTSTQKIKIPDVCKGLNIKYSTPFKMLRREEARFVLERMRSGS